MADEKLDILLTARQVTDQAFNAVTGNIKALTGAMFSFKGMLAGIGIGYGANRVAGSLLEIGSGFEQMKIKLDALTDGRGHETLERINAWAMEMPVNTVEAVNAFTMMQAMGLNPTIEKMETLVDVTAIFGNDAMPRVARALGQMQTLGRLSAEELNQMSEAGINARKYLTEAFGATVEEIQKAKIPIEQVIDAIWQGLDADYSGAARKARTTWAGLVNEFKSQMVELGRSIMDAGGLDAAKQFITEINMQMKTWLENNSQLISQDLPVHMAKIAEGAVTLAGAIGKIAEYAQLRSVSETFAKGSELASRGLLDFDKFKLAGFMERQKMVDAILNRGLGAEDADSRGGLLGPAAPAAIERTEKAVSSLADTTVEGFEAMDAHVEAYIKRLEQMASAGAQLQQDALIALTAGYDVEGQHSLALAEADQRQKDHLDDITAGADTFTEAWHEGAKTVGGTMENMFQGIISGTYEAADIVKSIFGQVSSKLFGAGLDALFTSAGIAHTGGIIGKSALPGRTIPAAAFAGAPRLHSGHIPGVLPGEYPAILKEDEGVFTPEQMAALGKGGSNNFYIQALDPISFEDFVRRNPGAVVAVVDENMKNNGRLRQTTRRTL